jgi:hypothetical protein
MKRRIDLAQLNQLTDEQKQKLREWWKPQEGDWFYNNAEFIESSIGEYSVPNPGTMFDHNAPYEANFIEFKDCLPLLDISQMIELLKSKSTQIRVGCEGELIVSDNNGKYTNEHFIYILNDDLCNELWETVKEVL